MFQKQNEINKLIQTKIQQKNNFDIKKIMELITFSSLPVSSQVLNKNANKFQMKLGQQNQEKQMSSEDCFVQTYIKKLIRNSYEKFKLQDTKIKQLYDILKFKVEPQRQQLLNKLIQNEKDLSSLKQMAKKSQFKNFELKSLFSKLRIEKDKQQKILSQLIEKKIQFFAQTVENQSRKQALQKTILQIKQLNQSKTIQIIQKQQKYRIHRQKFDFQLSHLNSSDEPRQKSDKYLVQKDLQVQKIKIFTQNATIYSQELRNCLSFRFQHLINLKQSKHKKLAQLTLLGQQNAILQEKIIFLESDLKSVEQNRKRAMEQTADEQFKYDSVKLQNIQLKARLQILEHSLSDQIIQSKQKQKMILDQEKLIDDAQISSIHTRNCLLKLIALKLQSEYLHTRIKYSIQK